MGPAHRADSRQPTDRMVGKAHPTRLDREQVLWLSQSDFAVLSQKLRLIVPSLMSSLSEARKNVLRTVWKLPYERR